MSLGLIFLVLDFLVAGANVFFVAGGSLEDISICELFCDLVFGFSLPPFFNPLKQLV